MPRATHQEHHNTDRVGWLRAAVLGANDGLVSVGSLVLGVAASSASHNSVLVAGLAAWIAGAMSMAAGEYVSVSSQADTEKADLDLEKRELERNPEGEKRELENIYMKRGLDRELAAQVADQLMKKDALGAHARDEIGISDATSANPFQAAWASALSFTLGVIPPLAVIAFVPQGIQFVAVVITTLVFLAVLGGLGAWTGGAPILKGVIRVTVWGAIALAVTGGVGALL